MNEKLFYIFLPLITIILLAFLIYTWLILHRLYMRPRLQRSQKKSSQRSNLRSGSGSGSDTRDIELGNLSNSDSAGTSSSNPPSTSQVSADTEHQRPQQEEGLINTSDIGTPLPKYTTQA